MTFIIVIRWSWLTEEVVLNTPPFLDNLKDRILPCFDSCSFVYFWLSFWRSRIGIVKLTFGAIRSIAKPFTKLELVSWINDFPTIVQFISPESRFRPTHQSESRIPNLIAWLTLSQTMSCNIMSCSACKGFNSFEEKIQPGMLLNIAKYHVGIFNSSYMLVSSTPATSWGLVVEPDPWKIARGLLVSYHAVCWQEAWIFHLAASTSS